MGERVTAEANVTYKYGGWNVLVNDKLLGRTASLSEATDMLYSNGYKVHTYRRSRTSGGKMRFDATVLVFNKEKE